LLSSPSGMKIHRSQSYIFPLIEYVFSSVRISQEVPG